MANADAAATCSAGSVAAGSGNCYVSSMNLSQAANILQRFSSADLTGRLADLEWALAGQRAHDIGGVVQRFGIDADTLTAAQTMKRAAARINDVVHALGIIACLPHLLDSDEKVEALSLGAGNTGRHFDLETTHRAAEFKFINWVGGPETIRQNQLFKDFYLLAEHPTKKRKFVYVLGLEHPLRFFRARRAISSVLSRHTELSREFEAKYGSRFTVVNEYYRFRQTTVELVDVAPYLPEFRGAEDTGDE